jgi:nitrite reductase/ring-hydroxylating ferredoxin subunit
MQGKTPLDRPEFLCRSDRLQEGQYCELETRIDGQRSWLVATRYHGQPRAWLNVCPHQGRPLNWAPNQFLADPQGRLVCAAHGAVFEPDRGQCVSGPCQNALLRAVEIEERGEEILLVSVNTAG